MFWCWVKSVKFGYCFGGKMETFLFNKVVFAKMLDFQSVSVYWCLVKFASEVSTRKRF